MGAVRSAKGIVDINVDVPGQVAGELYRKELKDAELIVWNGPMGVFEIETFCSGTMEIARAVADSSATTIIGGGDSVSAINKAGVADKVSHLSTGGGASLEFLSGKKLPGIESLSEA
jgi:phosphoglycerate kinase